MNPTVVAAAWLLLTGQVPHQAPVPLPLTPQLPVRIDCPAPPPVHLAARAHHHRRAHHRQP